MRLLCRFCHAPVARARDAIRIGSNHYYHFINPHGIEFQIGCYRQAPGCDIRGNASEHHSWFPGFRWQLAVCGDCHEHLGWLYQRQEQDSFYGLIVDKLVEETQGSSGN